MEQLLKCTLDLKLKSRVGTVFNQMTGNAMAYLSLFYHLGLNLLFGQVGLADTEHIINHTAEVEEASNVVYLFYAYVQLFLNVGNSSGTTYKVSIWTSCPQWHVLPLSRRKLYVLVCY